MNKSTVVADAGPLIAFARIDLLPALTQVLGSIIIPQSVADECTQDKSRPGAISIQNAIQQKIISVRKDPITDQLTQLKVFLGQVESAAIALG